MASQTVIDYCNKVFLTIGTAFLTDTEKDTLPETLDDLVVVYTKMFSILQERGENQTMFDKLKAKAVLADVALPDETGNKKFDTNILLGFGVDA